MRAGFGRLLWLSTLAQTPLLTIALAFLAVQHMLGLVYPRMEVPGGNSILLVLASTLMTLALVLVAYLFVRMALTARPKHPVLQLLRDIWAFLRSAPAMALGLPAFVSLVVFIYAFANVKGNIPVFQPFAWDQTFDRWDVVLHLGRRPWEWLQPLLGHWPVTFVINILYNLPDYAPCSAAGSLVQIANIIDFRGVF